MTSALSPVTTSSEFSFVDDVVTRSRSSTIQSIHSIDDDALEGDTFSVSVQTGTSDGYDSEGDDFVFMTRNPIPRSPSVVRTPSVRSEIAQDDDDRVMARPRVRRQGSWTDDESSLVVISDVQDTDNGSDDEDETSEDEVVISNSSVSARGSQVALVPVPTSYPTTGLNEGSSPASDLPSNGAYSITVPATEIVAPTPTPTTPTSSPVPHINAPTPTPGIAGPIPPSTSNEEKNRRLSGISFTCGDTAQIFIDAAKRLGKSAHQLTSEEMQAAKNQRRIDFLATCGSTSKAVRTAISAQVARFQKEDKEVMKKVAADLGKPVGSLTRSERQEARKQEVWRIVKSISNPNSATIPEPVKVAPVEPSHLNALAQSKAEKDRMALQEVTLSPSQEAEVLRQAARRLGVPLDQLTKNQRRKARRREREKIIPQSTSSRPSSTPSKASTKTSVNKPLVPTNTVQQAPAIARFDRLPPGAPVLNPDQLTHEFYQEIVQYITTYISAPRDPSLAVRLHFHQCLIIELGLLAIVDGELPTSNTSATKMLKEHAFFDVVEYVTRRTRIVSSGGAMVQEGIGPEELQKIMYPSQGALTEALMTKRRGSKEKVPLSWVKQRGLDVFLVPLYRHR
ncbi:hypothetical protein FRC02_008363 [Tulasnella sp. 418]|nr:hypothetical protein FRC02_008363 [Tulasnella sp. 418]